MINRAIIWWKGISSPVCCYRPPPRAPSRSEHLRGPGIFAGKARENRPPQGKGRQRFMARDFRLFISISAQILTPGPPPGYVHSPEYVLQKQSGRYYLWAVASLLPKRDLFSKSVSDRFLNGWLVEQVSIR